MSAGAVAARFRAGRSGAGHRRRGGHRVFARFLREFVGVRGGRRFLGTVAASAAALTLLGLALPLVTRALVDRLLPDPPAGLLPAVALALVVAGVAGLVGMVSLLRARALNALRVRADTLLARRFVRHVLRRPLPYFPHRGRGDLLIRLGSASRTREAATRQLLTLVLDAALLAGYLVGLALLWPGVALGLGGRLTPGTALAAGVVALSALAPVRSLAAIGRRQPALRGQVARMYGLLDAAEDPDGQAENTTDRAGSVAAAARRGIQGWRDAVGVDANAYNW